MKSRQAAVIFIFITVVLDMLAIGLIAPVLPKLVLSFLNNDMRRAANWNGIFLTVFAAMQFFFSPVIGVLSDRIGRRPVLLLSSLGLGLDYVVMALAPTIGWLFLGRIISGITASSIPTAMAYIADVTPREKRAGAFGLIGAAFGIGFTFGPVVGGLVGNTNPRMAFWVASAFSLANWLYGFFFVPESLPKDKRKEFYLASGQSGRLPRFAALPSGLVETGDDSISRLRLARNFRDLGTLRDVIALPGVHGALVIHFSLSVSARQ